MRKISMIVAAMALVLGLSQCKKDETPKVINEPVEIILDVRANSGAKIDVNTASGTVSFEQDDKVYVASGADMNSGKYVGTLTCRGGVFRGQITGAVTGQPLRFYFLGNMTPLNTLTPGSTLGCEVMISDQSSGKLPVISYAESNENFSTSQLTYTAYFYNKAALVKFNVASAAPDSATVLLGMKNKVFADFTQTWNNFGFSKSGRGEIILPPGEGEQWAILLPQDALSIGTGAYTFGGDYCGICEQVPQINENDYLFDGINVIVKTEKFVDLGLPSHKLWARWNIGANTPEDYGEYYAWGEIVTKSNYTEQNYSYNHDVTLTTLPNINDVAHMKWGNGWHMPTKEDFDELLENTTQAWTTRFGVPGYLFSSTVEGYHSRSIFFPAAGFYDYQGMPLSTGYAGNYWSKSYEHNDYNSAPYVLSLNPESPLPIQVGITSFNYRGYSVRAIHD